MKLKNILAYSLISILISISSGCNEEVLDYFPEDKMTSANFPVNEDDLDLLLNGLYSQVRERTLYNEGFFAFGVLDGATPNGYNWGGGIAIRKVGSGELSATDGQIVNFRWARAYAIIFRANYLLQALEEVELSESVKTMYTAEARFIRGIAYATLVESYGGVPIILSAITTEEARTIPRSSAEETWAQAIADYDVAIANLEADAPVVGRATKGAAMAMKMRAYLYQNKFDQVITMADQIIGMKYSLFPSYEGLFQLENENNQEVIFDIQYIRGEYSQGTRLDQFTGTGTGSWTRGTRYVPTEDLVNAYERIDGTPGKYFESVIDLDNPYDGWDPRLKVTVVVPGSYYLGYRYPNYLYPGGAYNHPGNRIKHLSTRKYREDDEASLAPTDQSDLNNIVMRYADVLLSKAEALIESGGSVDDATALINRIRTERDDVKMTPLTTGLSRDEARAKLRHERRVEFALEGLYWMDIKRWHKMDGFLNDIYPIEIRDHNGNLIETKFPDGYREHFNLLPIPNSELSLNENLEQNPGW
jgi:hypothetical protein